METTRERVFDALDQWSPRLFLLAAVILLVASANYAIAYLLDEVAFNYWIGLTVLIGRLVSLLGVAGLSVQIVTRKPRLGKLSRAVVSLAIVFTIGLFTLAVLENIGISTSIIAVFGLGTVLLSAITYGLFGVSLLRLRTSPIMWIGGLLLAATGALVVGFFGQFILSEGIIGAVAEGILFVTHLAIGYVLISQGVSINHPESAPNSVVE